MSSSKKCFDTLLAQAGHYLDERNGAIIPPLHTSTTYARDEFYELREGYIYSRYQNPTCVQAEDLAARLDGGTEALLFASGMAGITTLFETIGEGDHVVAPTVMYHGAQNWLRRLAEKRGISLTLFDASDPAALRAAVRPGETTIVWIESPVNPTWEVIDIAAAAESAHEAGAILCVDSTVSPPVTTRALSLGADIVFHSATKYLNGHTDVLAGLLVTASATERWEEIKLVRRYLGGVPGPFEAWLLMRGMRTLALRFQRASENALRIATHFQGHPAVESVLYPGLETHPGHAIAARQMTNGFGGMMSLLLTGGAEAARQTALNLKIFAAATSLGGVESLAEHRASVEGPNSIVQPNLLRLSIGIEDCDDLIADLTQALASATGH